jgi:methionyl-tRNA synthetase
MTAPHTYITTIPYVNARPHIGFALELVQADVLARAGRGRGDVALGQSLSLTVDDVIRTSRDPRHRPGVERFWRACAEAGDLYRQRYEGLYCTGLRAVLPAR